MIEVSFYISVSTVWLAYQTKARVHNHHEMKAIFSSLQKGQLALKEKGFEKIPCSQNLGIFFRLLHIQNYLNHHKHKDNIRR